jgi:hypothetical protein
VETARTFGARLPATRYHEVRYEDLVAEPETELRALLGFLGEEWDPAVLAFDNAQHDGTERYSRFTAQRRSEGTDGSVIYRSRVGAGRETLDPLLKTMLHRSSGSLLRDLGYIE